MCGTNISKSYYFIATQLSPVVGIHLKKHIFSTEVNKPLLKLHVYAPNGINKQPENHLAKKNI